MSIAFLRREDATQSGGSDSKIASGAIDVDAGALTVICGSHDPNGSNDFTSVTDTGSTNTFHLAGSIYTPSFGFSMALYYAYNCTAKLADLVQMNLSGAVPFRAYAVQEFSGLGNADPLADFQTASGTTSTDPQTVSTPSLTLPGGSTEGVVVAFGLASGALSAAGTGYNGSIFQHPDDPGVNHFIDEFHIVSASEAASFVIQGGGTGLIWGLIAGLFVPTNAASNSFLLVKN